MAEYPALTPVILPNCLAAHHLNHKDAVEIKHCVRLYFRFPLSFREVEELFRMLPTGLRYVPRVLVTDKLAGYGVGHQQLIPSVTPTGGPSI